MALEIIPLTLKGKIINKIIENEQTIFVFLFYNEDGINITPATTIYTDEAEQIDELSTQIYYGVYIEPFKVDDDYYFKFEYLNYDYLGKVGEDDYDNLTAGSEITFDNTKAGTYTITVSSGGKSAQFSVIVK